MEIFISNIYKFIQVIIKMFIYNTFAMIFDSLQYFLYLALFFFSYDKFKSFER